MGIDVNTLRFLLAVKTANYSFQRTLTIGRQGMHLTASDLRTVFAEFKLHPDPITVKALEESCNRYAEPLFGYLGAETIVSVDKSAFEGASSIHDMNLPIGDQMKERFDVVFDGGSLEHVFDFPTAIKNCMQAVRLGGIFLGCSPTNNECGHGFYQFSPELFFRVFAPENGFRIRQVILTEKRATTQWYACPDPASVEPEPRILITNGHPLQVNVIAQREAVVSIFTTPPQQSDYALAWRQGTYGKQHKPKSLVKQMIRSTEIMFPGFKRVTEVARNLRRREKAVRRMWGDLQSGHIRKVSYQDALPANKLSEHQRQQGR